MPGRYEKPLPPDGTAINDLARRLRQLRAAAGLTYDELAKESNYSKTSLQAVCSGRVPFSPTVATAFIAACGQDPASWQPYIDAAMAGSQQIGVNDRPDVPDGVREPPTPVVDLSVQPSAASGSDPSSLASTVADEPVRLPGRRRRRRRISLVAASVLALVATVVIVITATLRHGSAASPPSSTAGTMVPTLAPFSPSPAGSSPAPPSAAGFESGGAVSNQSPMSQLQTSGDANSAEKLFYSLLVPDQSAATCQIGGWLMSRPPTLGIPLPNAPGAKPQGSIGLIAGTYFALTLEASTTTEVIVNSIEVVIDGHAPIPAGDVFELDPHCQDPPESRTVTADLSSSRSQLWSGTTTTASPVRKPLPQFTVSSQQPVILYIAAVNVPDLVSWHLVVRWNVFGKGHAQKIPDNAPTLVAVPADLLRTGCKLVVDRSLILPGKC